MTTDGDQLQYQAPSDGGRRTQRVAALVDKVVARLARHWLAAFNIAVAVFFLLPFVAPLLMHVGWTGTGGLIYLIYRPTCHQLPDRSYFLFGPQHVYSVVQLENLNVLPAGLNILQREQLRWPGSPELGYKIAFCERDTAIYGSILLAGLVYGVARGRVTRLRQMGRRGVPYLPLAGYAVFLAPMILDGTSQLLGWRESNWWLRSITGALFGVATVWLAYPYIENAMGDLAADTCASSAPG